VHREVGPGGFLGTGMEFYRAPYSERGQGLPWVASNRWNRREWSLTCTLCKRTLAFGGGIMNAKWNLPTSEKEVLRILIQELIDATAENHEASDCFEVVMGQFPSGLPHPDGSQRIKNSSQRILSARKKVTAAHTRLSDFLDRGRVPDDLKRSR